MKSKKLISLLCAAAMTVSSFAGLTISASAAVGDELHKSDFEAVTAKTTEQYDAPVWNDDKTAATTKKVERVKEWEGGWGAANDQSAVYYGSAADAAAYMTNVIGSQKVDDKTVWTDDYATFKAATVTPPAVTGTKSLYFATQIGMNPAAKVLTIAPVIGTSASGIYGVNFDMMLVNADHQHPNFETNKKDRTYTVTLGGVKLSVTNENLSYYDANTAVDTGIDLTLAGTWLHFNLVYDAKNKQFKGKITPYDGDNLVAASEVTIPWAKFNGSAANLTTLSWQNERNDGANKGAANGAIDNFVVEELAETKYNDITVNIKSDGTVIKTYTANEEDGETYTAGAAYKAPFTTEASLAAYKYYKYDITSTDSVVSAEGATIDLNFIETDMPTVTFNATVGDSKQLVKTINEIKAVPGDSVSTYLNEYIKGTDNKWYQKDDGRTGGRGDMYEVTVKASEENSVETVNYKPANNVVSFLEAEDSENAVESEDGLAGGTFNTDYIRAYASGGVWAQSTTGSNYPTGFYTEPVAEAGTYEVTVRTHDMKRTAAIAKVAEDGTMTKIGQTTYDSGIGISTAKAELAAGEKIWVGKNEEIGTDDAAASTKLINDVDYIVVKDANKKADTDPVVTFSYANKVASLTSDKDRTVKAVVIHAQYSNGSVLTDVKQHPVDILSGATPTTVNIEEPVYEGDKFMVWETLDGLKPLLATPYTVPQGGGDAKPKFTVTVADNLANGTVSVDKPQAEQGETVTITATPASDAYELDTITVTDADSNAVTVSESNTFTMPAKNVTVTATFKAKPIAIAGTVTITGTAKVGETLTAAVENLTAGATAKYQWQLATAQDGEFTDVGGATEATKKLSSVSKDKYVRVVVTADGFDGQLVSNVLGPVGEAAAPITKYAITKVVDPADTATVTTTIGDGQEVSEVTDGINVTVNATAVAGNAVSEIIVKADGEDTNLYNAETKTFKMPAKAVTVTVKTVKEYTITKADAENGTFNVSATKAVAGTKISVTDITPAEGYKVDTVKFNETVIEAAEGAYSFTMPAENVTVTVTFASTAPVPVVAYDFEGEEATKGFADVSRITGAIVADDTTGTANNTKVLKFTNANNAGNGMAIAKLNFADKVQNATSATVEFDTYSTSGGRTNFSLFDGSIRGFDGNTYTKGQYNTNGVLFAQGSDANDAYKVRNDSATIPFGEWVHTVVQIDYTTQKISYTVQKVNATEDDEPIIAESVSYLDTNAKYATGLELYSWQNSAISYIDNVKVFAEIGTGNTVTINYVDGEGAAVKEAKTVAAVNTLPFTVDAAEKATFEANDVRYTYKAEGSTDTIAAVSDEAKTITLVFDKVPYQTVIFTVSHDSIPQKDISFSLTGTPTAEGAAAVNTTLTTGDDGTATIKLLPGTYTYSAEAGTYKAFTGTITVADAAVNQTIALESNAQILAAMEIDSSAMNTGVLTTTAASKVVGKLTTKQYANAEKTEPMVTPANVTWTTGNEGIAVAANGIVTITNAVTAGDYTITATSGDVTAEYTFTIAATGTEIVKAASEDFEGTTNIFGAEAKTALEAGSVVWKTSLSNYNNVLTTSADGVSAFTSEVVAVPEADKNVQVSLTQFNAYLGEDKNVVTKFKNSAGAEIASVSYNIKACQINDVKIGGTTVEGFAAFTFQNYCMYNSSKNRHQNANGWVGGGYGFKNDKTMNCDVILTLKADGTVTINFKRDYVDTAHSLEAINQTFTATLSEDVVKDFAGIEITGTGITNTDRAGGMDNLVTTIVPAE